MTTIDNTTLHRGDEITVLEGESTTNYTVLCRGHSTTHHRVYDEGEMRIKVLNTKYLAETRCIFVTRCSKL